MDLDAMDTAYLIVLNGDASVKLDVLLAETTGLTERLQQPSPPLDFCCIAADGGAKHLRLANQPAQAIIGDFDSLTNADKEWHVSRGGKLIHVEDQNHNDFDKCVSHAVNSGARSIWVAAFEGDRMDMVFGLLASITANIEKDLPAIGLISCTQMMVPLKKGLHHFHGTLGETISLLSFNSPADCILKGMEWDGSICIHPGFGGVSNRCTEQNFSIEVRNQTLWLFRQLPQHWRP